MRFSSTSSKDRIISLILSATAKGGIIISIASKVDCLQYQEYVTHKNIEQKRMQDRAWSYFNEDISRPQACSLAIEPW